MTFGGRTAVLALDTCAGATSAAIGRHGEVVARFFLPDARAAAERLAPLVKGLMAEALERALRHVFEELELHRVEANYQPTNERSGRLLRRLGFVVEGYSRDYLFIDGAWRDHVRTALTRPDPFTPPTP